MNLESGQLFFLNEVKGTYEWTDCCHKHFSFFRIVVVLILIYTCCSLSDFIVDTNQDEEHFYFTFLIGAGIYG